MEAIVSLFVEAVKIYQIKAKDPEKRYTYYILVLFQKLLHSIIWKK